MRYMRGLNQWLEHDVRDRQNEMRSIGARVDALRGELGRLGFQPTGMPMPMPVPPAEQGQPQGPSGQTFIIPPHIPPQPGVGFSPGPGVIPQGPMPMPGPGFPQPERPFTPGREGGPPVIPPFVAGPGGPPTSMEGFIPPRPSDMGMGPVIPDFSHFPRPGMPTPMPQSAYGDPSRFEYEEPPFVPPRPQMGVGSPMMPVPPPFMGPGQQQPMQPITVLPPPESRPDIHVVAPSDRTSTSSGSDRSLSPPRGHGDIHVHVPPSQPPLMAPGGMPGPPEAPPAVVRVPEGPVVGSPLHPAVQMQPSIIPTQAQGQQPFIVTAPTPAPTVPTDFPHEPIIIRSDGRRSRSSYRSASPGRDQPTVVVVPGPSSHRHRSRSPRSHVPTHVLIRSDPRYSPRSRSSSPRVQRVDTQRSRYSDRPRSHRHSRSYSRSPERRHRPRREDRDRSRSYSPDRRHRRRSRSYTPDDGRPHRRGRSRSRSPIIVQTGAPSGFTPSQQPPIVIPPPRSRSSSRSQGRPIILQPMQPPLPVLQGDQPHVQQPLQPPIGIPSQGTMLPDPGLGRHPSYPTYTRRSQSPSRYEPTQVPSQTPIVIHTTAERERDAVVAVGLTANHPNAETGRPENAKTTMVDVVVVPAPDLTANLPVAEIGRPENAKMTMVDVVVVVAPDLTANLPVAETGRPENAKMTADAIVAVDLIAGPLVADKGHPLLNATVRQAREEKGIALRVAKGTTENIFLAVVLVAAEVEPLPGLNAMVGVQHPHSAFTEALQTSVSLVQ
ncbi:hypothetical protein DFH11DRAFT_485268 [Phellopilus nigrolimitatus]|nr:hypothetical protein DFH11DRAFT_485268 [Phellopilus nigrolimitatus]